MSYLMLGAPLFSLFWSLYWLVVRPARKRRRAATVLEPRLPEGFVPPSAALAPPKPNVPRDTSRTYPRPARSRSKFNRICPVCGMEDPGNLDGKVLGWPAHRSCAEWLGDWKPASGPPPPSAAPPGTIRVSIKDSPGAQVNVNSLHAPFTAQQVETSAMMANGLISLDEAREQIVSAFSVPPPVLGATWSAAGDRQPFQMAGDGLYRPLSELAFSNRHLYTVTEQRMKPPGVPLMFCDCPCGREFIGTEDWLNRELTLHRGSGECSTWP